MELLDLGDDPLNEPSNKRGKRLKPIIIGLAVFVLLAGAGGALWYFVLRDRFPAQESTEQPKSAKHEEEPAKAPIFLALDPFIVNLQPSPIGKRMQVALSLQVGSEEQVEHIKLFMPEVRSRLLILLSGKTGADISTTEGKTVLTNEIISLVNQPFTGRKDEQHVTAVFFTSFVIQ
jgi:flagellar FliL protein